MTKIQKVCSRCGSENIVWDAWAYWDEEDQEFKLDEAFEQVFCKDCEGESSEKDIKIE